MCFGPLASAVMKGRLTVVSIALDNSIRTCSGLAASMGVRVLCGERAAGVRVLANSDRLAQVFINLISNAIKHNSSANPEVVVSGQSRGNAGYEARVSDNGPGISPENRENVFTKFFRGNEAQPGGVGLGLPISRQIAKRLGGELYLAEAGTGGAEFVVRLPRHNGPDAKD